MLAVLVSAAVSAAVSACSGGSAPATTQPAPTSAGPTSQPTAQPKPTALQAVCTRYNSAHITARQVVTSAADPILASGPALFLINLRQTAADAVTSVPESAAVFTELRDSIDDLNNQATAALPPGADGTKTLVTVKPARLGAALDAADKLCAPR